MNKDQVFLKHILDEIEFLHAHFEALEFRDLMADEVLQRACLRSLEIIGEASKNISDDLKRERPEIEWKKIAGLRDKLIHHYFGVDWELVWDVIESKLPHLEKAVKEMIDEEAKH